jgi:hypothetical protein
VKLERVTPEGFTAKGVEAKGLSTLAQHRLGIVCDWVSMQNSSVLIQ